MSRVGYAAIVCGLAIASTGGFAFGRSRAHADDLAFPHARHATLFPTTCAACHAGISVGDSTAMFPPPPSCAECHNGSDVKPVAWRGARRQPNNLRFDHVRHARLADSSGAPVDCQGCHATGAPAQRMNVARAIPATCVACHAHSAPTHLAVTSPCTTCHVPLARAASLSDSAVARLPRPAWHDTLGFISSHGGLAVRFVGTCATCHVRESCARLMMSKSAVDRC